MGRDPLTENQSKGPGLPVPSARQVDDITHSHQRQRSPVPSEQLLLPPLVPEAELEAISPSLFCPEGAGPQVPPSGTDSQSGAVSSARSHSCRSPAWVHLWPLDSFCPPVPLCASLVEPAWPFSLLGTCDAHSYAGGCQLCACSHLPNLTANSQRRGTLLSPLYMPPQALCLASVPGSLLLQVAGPDI